MVIFYSRQVHIEIETWVLEVVSRIRWVDGLGNTGV